MNNSKRNILFNWMIGMKYHSLCFFGEVLTITIHINLQSIVYNWFPRCSNMFLLLCWDQMPPWWQTELISAHSCLYINDVQMVISVSMVFIVSFNQHEILGKNLFRYTWHASVKLYHGKKLIKSILRVIILYHIFSPYYI